jgi:hypothetical protein
MNFVLGLNFYKATNIITVHTVHIYYIFFSTVVRSGHHLHALYLHAPYLHALLDSAIRTISGNTSRFYKRDVYGGFNSHNG